MFKYQKKKTDQIVYAFMSLYSNSRMKLTLHIINLFIFHSEVLGQIRGTLGKISWIGLATKFLKNYLLISFVQFFFKLLGYDYEQFEIYIH